jgi:hypothetical protein
VLVGDVVEVIGEGRAGLLSCHGSMVKVRYLAGPRKGGVDVVPIDRLKPIRPSTAPPIP